MTRIYRRRAGFSLVEVTLALGVAGFCLLAVFALLPMGVQTNQAAFSQTAATTILSDVSADVRVAAQANSGSVTSPMYGIVIPNSGSTNTTAQTLYFDGQGGHSTTIQTASRYRLAVTFPAPSSNAPYATCANIKISWPAAVDATSSPANAAGLVETVAAFGRP